MERVIEKLKTENASLKLVAGELIKQCEKEPAFIDKILAEKKTLDDCWAYVYSCAKKQAQNQVFTEGGTDLGQSVVVGWAIHYFDEAELEDWKPAKEKAETRNSKPVKSKVKKSDDEDFDEDLEDEDIEDADEEIEEQEDKSGNAEKTEKVRKTEKIEPTKKVEITKPTKKEKVPEGQISLFEF